MPSSQDPTEPYNVRWGLISTGGIVTRFTNDLLLPPAERGSSDVSHTITAVASRSLAKAQAFVKDHLAPSDTSSNATAYGSYDELFQDENVDVVYIGTPHPQHHRNILDALNQGKHVLAEKPFVLTEAQANEIFALAKERNRFVMEATWTRFQPIIEPAQRALFVDNKIGDIKRIESSFTKDFGDLPHDHRMLNPSLAGGGLFDLGPYAVLWPILLLFQHPKNERQPPTDVKASMIFDKRTGVDETTSWVMNFPLLGASATVTTSLSTPTPAICAIVYGTLGTLSLNGPSPYPHSYTIQLNDAPENANTRSSAPETFDYPIAPHLGRGMGWQADAVARCLRDGKLEEGKMRWEETVLQQRIFDEVRRSGGLDWGQGVEGL